MNKEQQQKHGFNWGNGITIAIVVFICATLSVVAYIVSLDYHMVTGDHYQEAENYQDHIERLEQTSTLEKPVEIELLNQDREIEIRFPLSQFDASVIGMIELYRPSNSSMDRQVQLNLNQDGTQRIKAYELAKGKWLVKVSWTSGEHNYYSQKSIFL